ncbi:hypothetical protein BAUCODRAFT_142540, partial [Baudoinia panamericana UAMH 10762]
RTQSAAEVSHAIDTVFWHAVNGLGLLCLLCASVRFWAGSLLSPLLYSSKATITLQDHPKLATFAWTLFGTLLETLHDHTV